MHKNGMSASKSNTKRYVSVAKYRPIGITRITEERFTSLDVTAANYSTKLSMQIMSLENYFSSG